MHRFPERIPTRALIDAGATIAASLALGVLIAGLVRPPAVAAVVAIGVGFALATTAALSILRRQPAFTTIADRVTLARVVLMGGCATLVTLSLFSAMPLRSWPLFALALPALALDAVDGWVARRTGSVSAPGARLDMETDAAFLVVLSIPLALVVGPWVLAIGAMRYLFAAASWVRPALRRPLSFNSFRRVVAGLQGVALVVALAPVVPVVVAVAATLTALVLLSISFGRDVATLERASSMALPIVEMRR